jgi:hypothetical protein
MVSVFVQSTMASPFATQQQQMAALIAHQQSMLMAATATAPGLQGTIKFPGLSANGDDKLGISRGQGGALLGQAWPIGVSQYPGSNIGAYQNGILSNHQVVAWNLKIFISVYSLLSTFGLVAWMLYVT